MIWGRPGGKIENGFIFYAGMPFKNYILMGGIPWTLMELLKIRCIFMKATLFYY